MQAPPAIHPNYLRALRRGLAETVLPAVTDPAARSTLAATDSVLVRLIAALEAPMRQSPRDADTAPAADLAAAEAARLDARETEVAAILDETPPARPTALAIDAALVQRHLDRRFPGDAVQVAGLEDVPGGRSKSTLMLTVADHARLPAGLVLRVDRPGSAQGTTVCDEYPVIAALHRHGVCTPEPLWLEPDPAALGAPFLVMRRMPGSVPGDYWSAGRATPELASDLAAALARLHAVPATAIRADAPASARDAVAKMFAEAEAGWRQPGAAPSPVLETAFAWLTRNLPVIEGASQAIHGDVHFGNVLAVDDRVICLTDWEFAHAGHPAEDLAFARGQIEAVMPWSDFLAAYGAAGGAPVSEAQLRVFRIWSFVRNVALSSTLLRRIHDGTTDDMVSLAIALNSRPRLETQLARLIAAESAADAAR